MEACSRDPDGDAPPAAMSPPPPPPVCPASDAAVAAPSPAAPQPPAVASPIPRSAAPPMESPLRWADVAEADDAAAARPIIHREPPVRRTMTRSVMESSPRRGCPSHPQARQLASAPLLPAPHQQAALGSRTARRRRAPAWGVAGRSD
nr:vegetative cell wall protein gp1-like [Aegilops tauschii subsp. strangulata]